MNNVHHIILKFYILITEILLTFWQIWILLISTIQWNKYLSINSTEILCKTLFRECWVLNSDDYNIWYYYFSQHQPLLHGLWTFI